MICCAHMRKTCNKRSLSFLHNKSGGNINLYIKIIVGRICEIYQYNCAKNGKGLKIGTKEAETI